MSLARYIPLYLVFCLLIAGCKKENLCDCVKGSGSSTVEKRELRGFTTLKIEDKVDVYFYQTADSSYEVTVEAGKHLLKLIKTNVVNGELQIKNDNKCGFMRSYKKDKIIVHVKAPHLYYITSDATGNFYSATTITDSILEYDIKSSGNINLDVNCAKVLGHMHGAGDVTLTGFTSTHYVASTGQSFINAESMVAGYTYIYYNSSGKAKVNVTGQLDAEITGSGNVYYTGNPGTVSVKTFGKGQLLPL